MCVYNEPTGQTGQNTSKVWQNWTISSQEASKVRIASDRS